MKFDELFSKSWGEYKNGFKTFFKIMFTLYFIPAIIVFILSSLLAFNLFGSMVPVQEDFGIAQISSELILFSGGEIILSIINFIFMIWMIASLVYYSIYNKDKMNFKTSIVGGEKYFWKYFGYGILLMLFIFLLLIVPIIISMPFILAGFTNQGYAILGVLLMLVLFIIAIILLIKYMVLWVFGGYVLVGENKGVIESFKISSKMVRGRWWSVFGYMILLGLIFFAISMCFGIISSMISLIFTIPYMVGGFSEALVAGGEVNMQIPLTISLISGFIQQIIGFITNLIIIPLGILFVKNFYLDFKKGKAFVQEGFLKKNSANVVKPVKKKVSVKKTGSKNTTSKKR